MVYTHYTVFLLYFSCISLLFISLYNNNNTRNRNTTSIFEKKNKPNAMTGMITIRLYIITIIWWFKKYNTVYRKRDSNNMVVTYYRNKMSARYNICVACVASDLLIDIAHTNNIVIIIFWAHGRRAAIGTPWQQTCLTLTHHIISYVKMQ